jgi:hypothetical protein
MCGRRNIAPEAGVESPPGRLRISTARARTAIFLAQVHDAGRAPQSPSVGQHDEPPAELDNVALPDGYRVELIEQRRP